MRIFQKCTNALGWTVIPVQSASDPESNHNVVISDFSYICDCPGFQFRGYCRHRAIAEENRCRWEEGVKPCQTPEERKARICPNCGDETVLVAEDDE